MRGRWAIRVLGTLEVRVEDGPVDIGPRRNREVLAALAIDAGRVVPSEVLLSRVWGDEGTGASSTNLHAILSRLRSRLAAAGIDDVVTTRAPGYLLDVGPEQVDALRFGRLLASARQLHSDGDVPAARAAVQEALTLWRGTAYADVRAPFAELEAGRLEEQRLAAVELAAELDLALGRHGDVVDELSALVARHPLREGLRGSLMTALYRTGRQADALQVYEQGRAVLVDELGLDPGPQLQRLHGLVLAQDPALLPDDVVAPRPASDPAGTASRPAGLVVPPTPLFGREADVEAVLRMLGSGARLVTLVGPGGVGKTRLAAAVHDRVAGRFPDGAVQVSLAPVADSSDVVATVARALGLTGVDGVEAIAAHVGPARTLLVLDNFEHLLAAAPAVGRLVALCPGLSVLVTSRSPLGLRVEREHAVHPLDLPPVDAATERQLASAPAGALLLDRARGVVPGIGSDTEEVAALARLCHRLSGLPLAIELVTSRLRTLPAAALLDRLGLALSAPGAVDLPERQRTMRAALDWSYGLLSTEQQRLFTLLGVFRGGAFLGEVEEVAAADGFAADEVLGLLDHLVRHSLVRVRPGPDGAPRFDMLEPVAEYSRLLLGRPRAERLVRSHASAYVGLAQRAATGYEHADQVTWLARTEADEGNLVAAVDRALELGDADAAGTITWSLWLYWWLRGGVAVGRRLAEHCLAHQPSSAVRPRVHLAAATMSYAQGDQGAAAHHWAEAQRLAAERADLEVLAKARAGTGLAALARGELDEASDRFRSSLGLCAEAGEPGVWMASLVHVWLGTVLLVQGLPREAEDETRRGLDIARRRGDRLSTYVALYNLSQVALAVGDDEQARGHLAEGIALSEQTGDRANLAHFVETLAVVDSRAGEHRRAATLLAAAGRLREDVGSVYGYYLPDESLRAEAEKVAREALGPDRYDEAGRSGRSFDVRQLTDYALGRR